MDRPYYADFNRPSRRAHCLRCIVWRVLIAWCVLFWVGVVAFIAVPAGRALVEAASARPAACQTLTADECIALAQDGGL